MAQYYPMAPQQQGGNQNELMAALLDGMNKPMAPPNPNGSYQLKTNMQLPQQTQNYMDMILSLINSGGAMLGGGKR